MIINFKQGIVFLLLSLLFLTSCNPPTEPMVEIIKTIISTETPQLDSKKISPTLPTFTQTVTPSFIPDPISKLLYQSDNMAMYTFTNFSPQEHTNLCIWSKENGHVLVEQTRSKNKYFTFSGISQDNETIYYSPGINNIINNYPSITIHELWSININGTNHQNFGGTVDLIQEDITLQLPEFVLPSIYTPSILFEIPETDYLIYKLCGYYCDQLNLLNLETGEQHKILSSDMDIEFELTPNKDELILFTSGYIYLLDLNNWDLKLLFSYDRVYTYSEAPYIAPISWLPDDTSFYVAVPSQESRGLDAGISIYIVNTETGSSSFIKTFQTGPLMLSWQKIFSPDQKWFSYETAYISDPEKFPELHIIQLFKSGHIVIPTLSTYVYFIEWLDNETFIYWDGERGKPLRFTNNPGDGVFYQGDIYGNSIMVSNYLTPTPNFSDPVPWEQNCTK